MSSKDELDEIQLSKILDTVKNKYVEYGPYVMIFDLDLTTFKDKSKVLNKAHDLKKIAMTLLQSKYINSVKESEDNLPLFNYNFKNTRIRNKCFKLLNYYKINENQLYVQFKLKILTEGNLKDKSTMQLLNEDIQGAKKAENDAAAAAKKAENNAAAAAKKDENDAAAAAKKAENDAAAAAKKDEDDAAAAAAKLNYDKRTEKDKSYNTLTSMVIDGKFTESFEEIIKTLNPLINIASKELKSGGNISKYKPVPYYSREIIPSNDTSVDKPEFRTCNDVDYSGDSIVESKKNGGIIMNPANSHHVGGGALSGKPQTAMEENLCRQSDLLTSLKVFRKQVPKDNNDYLTTSETCLVSKNTFKYLKSNNENDVFPNPENSPNLRPNFKYGELKQPHETYVLSIASPDMKGIPDDDDKNKNVYFNIMIKYWMLALQATLGIYNEEHLDGTPILIAVMPGDFIKDESGMPRDSLAKIAAIALRIALIAMPKVKVCFARQTRETMICREVFNSPLDLENLKYCILNERFLSPLHRKIKSCHNEDTIYRFIKAQLFGFSGRPSGSSFEKAIEDLKDKKQKGFDYIWYVMPQIKEIPEAYRGKSTYINKFYSIKNYNEAELYMNNDFLKENYFSYIDELTKLLKSKAIEQILGDDHKKCISSLTLFLLSLHDVVDDAQKIKDLLKLINQGIDTKTVDKIKREIEVSVHPTIDTLISDIVIEPVAVEEPDAAARSGGALLTTSSKIEDIDYIKGNPDKIECVRCSFIGETIVKITRKLLHGTNKCNICYQSYQQAQLAHESSDTLASLKFKYENPLFIDALSQITNFDKGNLYLSRMTVYYDNKMRKGLVVSLLPEELTKAEIKEEYLHENDMNGNPLDEDNCDIIYVQNEIVKEGLDPLTEANGGDLNKLVMTGPETFNSDEKLKRIHNNVLSVIDNYLNDGLNVRVSCQQGLDRSALIVQMYLIAKQLLPNRIKVIKYVQDRRFPNSHNMELYSGKPLKDYCKLLKDGTLKYLE